MKNVGSDSIGVPNAPVISNHDPARGDTSRQRTLCVDCLRPVDHCYCELVPKIENQTEIILLQHSRERDHPFNTARMAHLGLTHSRLIFGSNAALAKADLKLGPRAGLLYPSKTAIELNQCPAADRPKQLVLLDGTWSQSRTMLRDIPQLHQLPCYQLAPSQPGQYRIRLEPTDTSLSTVEAAVQALQAIEPETARLEQLLDAFHTMVQRQLDHPLVGRGDYSGGPKSGRTVNVPKLLLGDPAKLVVAYGEAAYRDPSIFSDNTPRPPLFWVAQRLDDSPRFVQALTPDVELTPSFLNHIELPDNRFDESISQSEFVQRWNTFLEDDDVLVVFSQGTADLLDCVRAKVNQVITLKSINYDDQRPRRTLCDFVGDLNLKRAASAPNLGRAGKRLDNAIGLLNHLRHSNAS